jgi:hypothetical protein
VKEKQKQSAAADGETTLPDGDKIANQDSDVAGGVVERMRLLLTRQVSCFVCHFAVNCSTKHTHSRCGEQEELQRRVVAVGAAMIDCVIQMAAAVAVVARLRRRTMSSVAASTIMRRRRRRRHRPDWCDVRAAVWIR